MRIFVEDDNTPAEQSSAKPWTFFSTRGFIPPKAAVP
jgi:hypothetical protein